jgi:hypothetical protein
MISVITASNTGKIHEVMASTITQADIDTQMLALLQLRLPPATLCPSEVARSLAKTETEWRALMPRVRESAYRLARARRIEITQGGVAIDPGTPARGAVRLRRINAQSGE